MSLGKSFIQFFFFTIETSHFATQHRLTAQWRKDEISQNTKRSTQCTFKLGNCFVHVENSTTLFVHSWSGHSSWVHLRGNQSWSRRHLIEPIADKPFPRFSTCVDKKNHLSLTRGQCQTDHSALLHYPGMFLLTNWTYVHILRLWGFFCVQSTRYKWKQKKDVRLLPCLVLVWRVGRPLFVSGPDWKKNDTQSTKSRQQLVMTAHTTFWMPGDMGLFREGFFF